MIRGVAEPRGLRPGRVCSMDRRGYGRAGAAVREGRAGGTGRRGRDRGGRPLDTRRLRLRSSGVRCRRQRCHTGLSQRSDSNQRPARGSLRRATRLVTFQATQPKSAYRHLFMFHKVPAVALTETSPVGALAGPLLAQAARSKTQKLRRPCYIDHPRPAPSGRVRAARGATVQTLQ